MMYRGWRLGERSDWWVGLFDCVLKNRLKLTGFKEDQIEEIMGKWSDDKDLLTAKIKKIDNLKAEILNQGKPLENRRFGGAV